MGGVGLGRVDAVQTASAGPPVTLFTTSSELGGGAGWQVFVGRRVADRLHAEAGLSWQRVPLTTLVMADAERGAPTRASERIMHIQLEGGIRWSPARLMFTRRTSAFGVAGGGYLRQLHAGRTLIESGRSFYAGGGVLRSMWTGTDGKRIQARLEGRMVVVSGGVAFDRSPRATPAVAVAAQMEF